MKRLLFICSQNRLRSPTAEQIFSQWPGVEAKSAGLDYDAVTPLSPEALDWADVIVVMEKAHKNKLSKKYKEYLVGKRIVVLSIPDEYEFMQPELIALLKEKVPPFVGLDAKAA